MNSLGERLKLIRKTFGLTQKEMAKIMGASLRVYQYYEKGEQSPSYERLVPIIKKFNINGTWLLTGEGEMFLSKSQDFFSLFIKKEDEMIGKRLKQLRKALNLSQSKFGELLGTTQRAVSHWERDEAEPSFQQLKKLIDLFNVNPTWLLTGEGEMFLSRTEAKNIGVNYGGMQIGNIMAETIGTINKEVQETSYIPGKSLKGEIRELINKEIELFQKIQKEKPQMLKKAINKLSRDVEELEELIL